MFGREAEAVFEEIASRGSVSCSDCVRRVCSLIEVGAEEAARAFSTLCNARLIIRSRLEREDEAGEGASLNFVTHIEDPYAMPEKFLDRESVKLEPPQPARTVSRGVKREETDDHLSTKIEPPSGRATRKRKAGEPVESDRVAATTTDSKKDSDWRILWRVNWDRVDYHMRDELVIAILTLNEAFDKQTLSAARLLLKVAEVKSHPSIRQSPYVSVSSIKEFGLQYLVVTLSSLI